MTFSPALLIVGANPMRSAIAGIKIHTGNPGAGGVANASSAAMQTPVWSTVDSSGDFGLASPVAFTGGTPNGAATYISLWSGTGGSPTWYGNFQLSGDLTFDSSGNYTLETFSVSGTSS